MKTRLEIEQEKLAEKNKAREKNGLKPIVVKMGNCNMCGKKILIINRYKCKRCTYIANIMNYENEIHERNKIFDRNDERKI